MDKNAPPNSDEIKGYGEFELDLPASLKLQLVETMKTVSLAPLNLAFIGKLPPKVQGLYALHYKDELVYVGKTDSTNGFCNRLQRHYYNIQHRKNLDPEKVMFKALRVLVFNSFDVEAILMDASGRPIWNTSGFGSNDPGHNRDEQDPGKFDLQYPVNIDCVIDGFVTGERRILDALLSLKDRLPYLLRYQTDTTGSGKSKKHKVGHEDMRSKYVTIPSGELTTRQILVAIVNALGAEWQVTVMPNRVILYKNDRRYPAEVERIKGGGVSDSTR